ncbi:tetratricopeptide repeat protein [Aeromonas diversa]|uniref:tetratricopeptide repeat protein n=1 Tax=Aeromonas diversa TaxID=502790 RepID=UPI003462A278
MNGIPDFMACWDYAQPAATAERFIALLPQLAECDDPQPLLELKTQLARTHSLRRQFDEAHALLDEVEPALTDATPRARLRYLLERGRSFNSAGRRPEALPCFEQAWQLALKLHEDTLAVDAAHMMAIALPTTEQTRWHQQAIALAERSKEEGARRWLPSLWNNLAWTLFDQGRLDEALTLQHKCLEWHEEHERVKQAFIARWSIGRILREQGKRDEAWASQLALQEAMDEAGQAPDGYLFEELGELALLRQDPEVASEEFFARAWFLLSKEAGLAPERLERLKRLAKL